MIGAGPQWSEAGITGHRPTKRNPIIRERADWIIGQLDETIGKLRDRHGCTRLHSGLAIGPDMWAAKLGLRHGLDLFGHVPFPGQDTWWPPREQARYASLILAAGSNVRRYGDAYDVGLYHKRDRGVVDASRVLIAVWDITVRWGGTFETVRYAAGLPVPPPVIVIDPRRMVVRQPSAASLRALLAPA